MKVTRLHGVEHRHGGPEHGAEHLLVQPLGHGEQRVHQREAPEEAQRQHALRRGHVDVDDVVGAGRRDNDRQVDGRRGGVGVLRADEGRRRRVGGVPPDLAGWKRSKRQTVGILNQTDTKKTTITHDKSGEFKHELYLIYKAYL